MTDQLLLEQIKTAMQTMDQDALEHFKKLMPRKLPHQVDNSKLEIPVLNVLGMNSMGVLSPRESWGLNSL